MTRWLLTLILTCGAAVAQAQYPGYQGGVGQPGFVPGPGQFQPNMYNRQNQPLSPYLNLLRGQGNPGIDYYYGVRPGLPSGGQPFANQFGRGGGGNQSSLNYSQMRTGYLPQAGYQTTEPIPLPDAGQDVILSPSGHGVVYGNTFGISRAGVPGASNSRPGFFAPPVTGSTKPKKK
jgi:hypothetical protein